MNVDIRLSLGFFDHPKTMKLAKRCGMEAVICLQRLWMWAAEQRPSGVLTGMDEEDIELAAKWTGEEGKFVRTLIDLHWLDEKDEQFILHGWDEHQAYASKSEERHSSAKKAAEIRWEKKRIMQGQCGSDAEAMRGACDAQCGNDATSCDAHANSNAPKHQDTSLFNTPLSSNEDIPPQGEVASKGKRKETITSVLDEQPQELIPALTEFVNHRKSIKKPLTAHALRLNIKDLQRLAPGDIQKQKELIEYAIKKGWQGFYLPNEEQQYANAAHVPRASNFSQQLRLEQDMQAKALLAASQRRNENAQLIGNGGTDNEAELALPPEWRAF